MSIEFKTIVEEHPKRIFRQVVFSITLILGLIFAIGYPGKLIIDHFIPHPFYKYLCPEEQSVRCAIVMEAVRVHDMEMRSTPQENPREEYGFWVENAEAYSEIKVFSRDGRVLFDYERDSAKNLPRIGGGL